MAPQPVAEILFMEQFGKMARGVKANAEF